MPEGDMPVSAQGFSTPRPDPTLLTTEQLLRAITALETTVKLHIAAVDERLTAEIKLTVARFDTTDIAMIAIRDIIEEKVEFAKQDRASIRAEISGRFIDAEKTHDAISALTSQKFRGVAEEHAALREMLNERYQTQTKALDAAFLAQQAAVKTSFDASEKQIAAALLAAKEAVDKANVATEKRFDGVNELLGQQNAALSVMLPRAEAESRMRDLDRRVGEIASTVDKGFTGTDVRSTVGKENWGVIFIVIGLLVAIVVPIVVVLITR